VGAVDKRPSGLYRARWREFPGGPQKSATFTKKTKAEEFLRGVETDLARGVYVDPTLGRQSFGEYADAWAALQPWRPSTRARVGSLMSKHVRPGLWNRPIGKIRTSEIQAWTTGLAAPPTSLAPSTVESAYRLVAAIFKAAIADRVIAAPGPAAGVRLASRTGELLVPLTVVQVRAIS
jgi:hypothetical protein